MVNTVGPISAETRVNTFTPGTQSDPAIVILADGTMVVAWTSSGQDGSGDGVYAQRIAADGTALGAEFRVATTTADDQRDPSLAALADGGFIVTWEGRVSGADGFDIYAQRYDASGAALGSQFIVNGTTASFQGSSSVAGLPNGGFIVTWHSLGSNETSDVYGRLFNADGTPAASEFRVNSFTTGNQDEASVTVLAGGGFVVTWQSENQDGSSRGVYGQVFDAAGGPVGTEFRANTITAGSQQLPAVAALEGGGFVIVWGGNAIRGQVYAADGTPVGNEIPIATGFNGVSVTAMQGGGFAVSWDELSSGGSGDGNGFGVVARAFNASGAALGDILVINETTAGDQRTGGPGSLGQLADGSIALVWAGNGTGDTSGVFVRYFDLGGDETGPGPIVGTSDSDSLTGTAGDDVIRGLGSNDDIDGLGGNDIAEYSGLRSDYRVTVSGGVYTIDDQREGSPDGTDTLTNIDQLRFGDGETVAIADAVAPTLAPGVTPLTNPVLINTPPESGQIWPMTVALTGGGYAVVWIGGLPLQSSDEVLVGRAFNAAGQPVGGEFVVGTMDFLSEEQVPTLTALAGGGFAVAWMGPSDDLFDQYQDLQIQIYDATGAEVGGRINAGSTGRFSTPVLVGTDDGGFLLIRDPESGTDNFSTTGQFFNASGTAIGSAFPIGANVGDSVSAAILTNGDIVIAWNEPPQLGGERAFVRLFSPTGQPRGDAFVADSAQPASQSVPSVAALAGGGFVMTWFHSNPDADIYARIFDAAGNPVSATFNVNENTAGTQWYGYVQALDDGGFVVSWTGDDGSNDGVFARAFDANGQPRGGEVRINPEIAGNQEGEIHHLAQLANGNLVFSWTGAGADGTNGVFARLFALAGSTNPDPSIGTDGDDMLYGGAGDDILQGLAGNDVLDGKGGADKLYGGVGNDTYHVDTAADLVFENPGEGTNTVVSTASFYLYANIEKLTLADGAGDLFGVGNDLNNTLTGNGGSNLLIGGDGADTINGGAGGDSLFGEAGNDALNGDAGIDYLAGGAGDDALSGGDDSDALYGEDGNDTLSGGSSFDTDILVGGAGNDTLYGDSGQNDYDLMDGGSGDDAYYVDTGDDLTFEAIGGGTDTVYADVSNVPNAGVYLYANVENLVLLGTTAFGVGNELDNQLTGSASGNWLLGGAGNDRIDGKGGNDVLFGEAGSDTFVFGIGSGGDVIGDFVHGTDEIDLSAYDFASFTELSNSFHQVGSDGAIDLGGGNLIVLLGVTMSSLDAGDFIL